MAQQTKTVQATGRVTPTQPLVVPELANKDCWIPATSLYVHFSNRLHISESSNVAQNATWIINHLKVYKKQLLNGQIGDTGSSASLSVPSVFVAILSLLFSITAGLLL